MKAPGRLTRALLILATLFASTVVWSACRELGFREPDIDPAVEDPGLIGLPNHRPRATRAYLATLRFTTVPKISTVTCHNGATVPLRIHPELRSYRLDPLHAAMKGRIVARVVNGGTSTCDDLALAPGDTAYWRMGPARGFPLTMDFWRIPEVGEIRRVAHAGPTIVYRDTTASAPDASISPVSRHASGAGKDDDDGDGGALRFRHLSTWIECLGGCCESNGLLSS